MPAGGDARRSDDREGATALLRYFTTPLLTDLHVVKHSVCDGEGRSLGQALADRLQVRVHAATGESLERAVSGLPGVGQPVPLEWRCFLPGAGASAASPARPAHRPRSGLTGEELSRIGWAERTLPSAVFLGWVLRCPPRL